ncbi:MAG TPA: glycosyltransferase family 4 protein [Thermodesulfobacteriota bacterium]|nr:glycosyltransferase family 4 protein [Thermodesulfobacteriota bacterium]
MRIAQVAPLFERVPPLRYGGTERVVSYLTEALVARGHQVTLFASGDSRTSARLVPVVPRALWHDETVRDRIAPHVRQHAEVFARAAEFDVIHTHTDYFAFPYLAQSPAPVLTTMHGRCDLPEVQAVLRTFTEARLVAISQAQRDSCPGASWVGVVHHGLPVTRYRFDPEGGERLLFLGRIAPEKAPQLAIDVAVEAGLPLTIAARVDPADRQFFEQEVRPRLAHPLVRFIGEVDDAEKQRLLGRSLALLVPLDWPEPFGLVMIEAMACGTPVVARPLGAAPEVVVDGETGYLADSRAGLVAAVRRAARLSRLACRRHVEAHFTVERMAERYEQLYRRLLAERRPAAAAS